MHSPNSSWPTAVTKLQLTNNNKIALMAIMVVTMMMMTITMTMMTKIVMMKMKIKIRIMKVKFNILSNSQTRKTIKTKQCKTTDVLEA